MSLHLFWQPGSERGGTVGWRRWQILEEGNPQRVAVLKHELMYLFKVWHWLFFYTFFSPEYPNLPLLPQDFTHCPTDGRVRQSWLWSHQSYGTNVPLLPVTASSTLIPHSLQLGKKRKKKILVLLYTEFSCAKLWFWIVVNFFLERSNTALSMWCYVYCLLVSKASPKYAYKCRMVYMALKSWACIVPFFLRESI